MNKLIECSPEPICRCCQCQGIMCYLPHPGHSHQLPTISKYVMLQAKELMKRS